MEEIRQTFRIIDLFAGAGGFSEGFLEVEALTGKRAFEVVKAVEIDRAACINLIEHLESYGLPGRQIVFEGDIGHEFTQKSIIKEGIDKKVDIIIGGPPCQTFSLVGPARVGASDLRLKLSKDPRNKLYRHFLEIVEAIRPAFVVFENVEGIVSKRDEDELTGNSKRVIEFVTDSLRDIGYDPSSVQDGEKTRDYLVLNAANFGVPQFRKRVIIIANRLGIPNPIPKPNCGPVFGTDYSTTADAIEHLPVVLSRINTVGFDKLKKIEVFLEKPDRYLRFFVDALNKLAVKYKVRAEGEMLVRLSSVVSEAFLELEASEQRNIASLRKFVDVYNSNLDSLEGRDLEHDRFPAPHISRPHNIRDVCIFSRMEPGTNSAWFMKPSSGHYNEDLARIYPYNSENHEDTYVKQSWKSPSTTILSHMNRDGLRFIHPEQPRTYTPCEAALLQSFRRKERFSLSRSNQSDIFRQIGNAVPPLMARAIAKAIYDTLIDYQAMQDSCTSAWCTQ